MTRKQLQAFIFAQNSDLLPPSSTNNQTGIPFIELRSVDSTNNYAMQLVNNGLAVSGTAVFAYEQSSGKGQRGKQWLTAKGMNITMSLVLNVNYLPVSRQFLLSAAIALATNDFLKAMPTAIAP